MNGVLTLPRLTVAVQGVPLALDDGVVLEAVRVRQELQLPTLCELTFVDSGARLLGEVSPGASLRVGVTDANVALFVGDIIAVEYVHGPSGESQVRVRSYDALHRLRKVHEAREHVEVTLADLARQLLGPSGLPVAEPGESFVWKSIIQHGQSNLEFLTDVCRQCGMYFTVHDGSVRFLTLEGEGSVVPLVLGDSLIEARIELNGEAAVDAFSVTGWNPLEVREYTGHSGSARVGRAISTEISASTVSGESERSVVGGVVQDTKHADLIAQGELDRYKAREVVFWGVAQGDPGLRPGAIIDVRGTASAFEGRYVLTSVTHTIDAVRGFISELSTVPPAQRSAGGGLVTTFGLVTRVDDPESLGRIRASLPAFGAVETDWLQVLAIGGGADKGLLMVPDTGDRILVLCSSDDPAHGVVVGGLFGPDGSPDSGVVGDSVRRYALKTSGGQMVQVDDEKGTIRLANADGSYFELSPDKVKVHAAQDLELEAPGKKVTIRGQSIDFERG